jgi:hypothetical protein
MMESTSVACSKIVAGDLLCQYGTIVRLRGPLCLHHQAMMKAERTSQTLDYSSMLTQLAGRPRGFYCI